MYSAVNLAKRVKESIEETILANYLPRNNKQTRYGTKKYNM
jgi:hypothetical protein